MISASVIITPFQKLTLEEFENLLDNMDFRADMHISNIN